MDAYNPKIWEIGIKLSDHYGNYKICNYHVFLHSTQNCFKFYIFIFRLKFFQVWWFHKTINFVAHRNLLQTWFFCYMLLLMSCIQCLIRNKQKSGIILLIYQYGYSFRKWLQENEWEIFYQQNILWIFWLEFPSLGIHPLQLPISGTWQPVLNSCNNVLQMENENKQ